jgi:hypothetical protein
MTAESVPMRHQNDSTFLLGLKTAKGEVNTTATHEWERKSDTIRRSMAICTSASLSVSKEDVAVHTYTRVKGK